MLGITATYEFWDTHHNPEKKAEGIALGMTVGSWTSLSAVDKEQLQKHKAVVTHVENLGIDERFNVLYGKQATRARADVFFPAANYTIEWSAILTAIFGKLSLDGSIRLLDLTFSNELKTQFPGPKFGIEGIRKELDVYDRPLTMSIFKGMLGRNSDYIANALYEQAIGGIDLVKDDEIMFENELAPFKERVTKGREVLQDVYEQTGHRTLYAVNVTGTVDQVRERARWASANGADALLFNVFTYGLDTLVALRNDPDVTIPIMAHPALSGTFASAPLHGMSFGLMLGKALRMSGADFSLFPSPYGSVAIPKTDAQAIHTALQTPDLYAKAWSVPSAGIHPALVPQLMEDFGTDCIINAGGGIHGHPSGTASGAKAFRQAVDEVLTSGSLEYVTETSHPELYSALEIWK
ncbi:MAG: 2,3-diketo-5-methylthiopentyl-1-phosphate enolase [Bacilli bacterium]